MASAQTMPSSGRCAPCGRVILAIALAALLGGCFSQKLPPRNDLYSADGHEHLWAVVPPLNESGVSIIDPARVADMIARELRAVHGIDVLPVNRILAHMQRMRLESVTTDAEAAALMEALEVDGLIVGTITDYDPYPPPVLGLALQLHGVEHAEPEQHIDPVAISRTTVGEVAPGRLRSYRPLVAAAGVFDARDRRVQQWLADYAAHRHLPDSAYGADVFLVSMDLYTQFVSHRLIRRLLQRQREMAVAVNQP